MKFNRLNQVLAVEKSVKTKRENDFTKVYQAVQHVASTMGETRTYAPLDAEGERLAPQSTKVMLRVDDAVATAADALRDLFNVTAVKDATNMTAKADVVIDDKTLVKDVPAVHLLFIEKRLTSIIEFINKLPTLTQGVQWKANPNTGLFESEPEVTGRMKKVTTFPVIVQATDKHPAQVKEVVNDQIIGNWTAVTFSGAITTDRKKQLLQKAEKVQQAVKVARENANQAAVVELTTSTLVDYIFK